MMILSLVDIPVKNTGIVDGEASESDEDAITSGHSSLEHRYS